MQLPKVTETRKKRVGRGVGSGKGSHTSGRGQKGQKSNTDLYILFEGLKTKKSFLKRLPLMRGKGKFHAKGQPETLNLEDLESLPTGSVVTVDLLIKNKLVDPKLATLNGVKILGNGETTKKFTFEGVTTSKSVVKLFEIVEKVEKAPKEEVKASK
jgi:large subunit ribosomal protein L15